MKLRALFFIVTTTLLFSSISYASVKTGTVCSKLGATSIVSGKKYTCVKSGKNLIWDKGVLTKSVLTAPTASTTLTPTPIPTPSQPQIRPEIATINLYIKWSDNKGNNTKPNSVISSGSELSPVDLCKIPDAGVNNEIVNNPQRHFVNGFSPYPERATFRRTPVIQFVPVDFPNLQGQRSPAEDLKPITDFLQKFWSSQSTKPLKLDFRIPKNYIRLPKNVEDYQMTGEFFAGQFNPDNSFNYVREALAVTDSTIDFSDTDIIAVIVPSEVKRSQIAAFVAEASESKIGGFQTKEKKIYNTLIMAGQAGSEAYELLNWAHELGHMFGFSDLRNTTNVSSQDSSDLGIYDLMNSEIAPELLGWQRFIVGLLNDDQVRCVNGGTTTHLLRPVEMATTDPKLLVIPTGKYTAIGIESRRAIGFDANLGTLSEGVLVYEIDTTIPYRKSALKLVIKNKSTDFPWRRDAALKLGESVIANGWQISVIESGDFGDVIKVQKLG